MGRLGNCERLLLLLGSVPSTPQGFMRFEVCGAVWTGRSALVHVAGERQGEDKSENLMISETFKEHMADSEPAMTPF